MNTSSVLRQLLDKNVIAPPQYEALEKLEKTRPISIHWEIRTIIGVGISLLTGGLGILIYKNIDTIGHQVIIFLIAVAIVFCGWYVFKKRLPYSNLAVKNPNPTADNLLLLGCSLFLILEGYLQYQYAFFGTQYGLATLIPAVLFLALAYRFDHLGVLTMAITALVSWAGITTTPLSILQDGVFSGDSNLILTGISVGIVLMGVGQFLNFQGIKPHFTFSFLSFGLNLLCIAAIYAAINNDDDRAAYSVLCLLFSALAVWYARREASFFFLLAGVVYGYVSFTILLSTLGNLEVGWIYYGFLSCGGVVAFFLNYKSILGVKK